MVKRCDWSIQYYKSNFIMEQALICKMASWMPWAKNKRSSEEEEGYEDEPNLLLSLLHPDVTNVVLDYLDTKSLLNLRLVCKRTKMWVDHPRFLARVKITLHSSAGSKRMRKVLRSKVNFCNFRIGWEKRNNEDLIMEFGIRYGSCLKILDINTMTSHNMLVNLLSQCPFLESLTLLGINLLKLGPSEIDDLKRITPVLSNLRALSIGNVLFIEEEEEMAYFRRFLSLCGRLHSLRLPYVNFQSKRPKELRDEILGKYVLNPVIESIQNRSGNNMKYLILEYLNPLPPNLFFHLAQTCFESHTILHNVHESHLKRLKNYGTQDVQQIIGTLDGLNENILLGKLDNLKCISIWVSAALTLSDRNYENPALPKLTHINLYMDTVEEDPRCNRLISTILGTPRPTTTSLKISYNSRKGAISAELVRAIDIANNFEYLRKLDIYQWDAYDEEFLILWKGLGAHRIQDLSLLLCTNLSDRGLLGWGSRPALCELTSLKELHISSLYGSITDATIIRALRHIPLQKLRLYSPSVTYEGLTSLMDGIFYKSVEYIHCSKPLDCTQKEFFFLMKNIIKAKTFPEPVIQRHLRRRSHPFVFSEPSDEDDED